MPDLIDAHGGLGLIDRTVADREAADFRAKVPGLAAIPVTDADLSTLYRIADGGLSPLVGPMVKAVYDRVLEEEVIETGGRKYAWTIPLAFPVEESLAKQVAVGSVHPLKNDAGDLAGTLLVQDVYPWDKAKYNAGVYGTPRSDHP